MPENVSYHWPELAHEDDPGGTLVTASIGAAENADIQFFSSPIFATAGQDSWVTLSRVEVAYGPARRQARVFWKIGVPQTAGLPEEYLSEWTSCLDPTAALDQVSRRLAAEGRPIVGVSLKPHPTVSYFPPVPVVY